MFDRREPVSRCAIGNRTFNLLHQCCVGAIAQRSRDGGGRSHLAELGRSFPKTSDFRTLKMSQLRKLNSSNGGSRISGIDGGDRLLAVAQRATVRVRMGSSESFADCHLPFPIFACFFRNRCLFKKLRTYRVSLASVGSLTKWLQPTERRLPKNHCPARSIILADEFRNREIEERYVLRNEAIRQQNNKRERTAMCWLKFKAHQDRLAAGSAWRDVRSPCLSM